MVVFSRDFPIAVCNRIDVPFTFVIHVMYLLAFESTVVFVIEILAEILCVGIKELSVNVV